MLECMDFARLSQVPSVLVGITLQSLPLTAELESRLQCSEAIGGQRSKFH